MKSTQIRRGGDEKYTTVTTWENKSYYNAIPRFVKKDCF